MLPRATLRVESRNKAIRKFWVWVLTSKKSDNTPRATNAGEAITWIREYFARAAENEFLTGVTPRGEKHGNWSADIDFLLTERGMKHVIEKTRVAA